MAMYPYVALRGPPYRENSHANHTWHSESRETAWLNSRADTVAALVAGGLADQVCLSQDHLCCLPAPRDPFWIPPDRKEWFDREIRPSLEEEMFGRPHTYLFTDFLPRLASRGLDAAMIDRILVDNPRRLLAGE